MQGYDTDERTDTWVLTKERNSTVSGETAGDVELGQRLGLAKGMTVQELGWEDDVDDAVRVQIEDTIDADMVDGEHGDVVDAVVLWWRNDDGDLVDALVDSLTDLASGGAIWLFCPKVGRPRAVDPADVTEAAPVAGLSTTSTFPISQDWSATKLVAPKGR